MPERFFSHRVRFPARGAWPKAVVKPLQEAYAGSHRSNPRSKAHHAGCVSCRQSSTAISGLIEGIWGQPASGSANIHRSDN
ncbi:hypothetical protein [Paenibacillus sp. NPDC057934]|uniref:hypothetical protein n=1 Tax=Paenibacillus sp. NPDC057934 TaxID=3346282 RepID=UPI0036DF056A